LEFTEVFLRVSVKKAKHTYRYMHTNTDDLTLRYVQMGICQGDGHTGAFG